jgi:hypothetical protein
MQMDRNMSGAVTPQEFKNQTAKMNMLLTDEEVKECFRLATKSEDAKFLNYPQVRHPFPLIPHGARKPCLASIHRARFLAFRRALLFHGARLAHKLPYSFLRFWSTASPR